MSPAPEPDRLSLRGVSLADAAAVMQLLAGDTELALQTATIPIPYTIECAEHFLSTADPRQVFSVVVDGDVVGMVGMIAAADTVEIGYWIGRIHWRRGYATAAVYALLQEARRRGISRLAAEVFPGNAASQRVLEKNGFLRIGEVQKDLPQRGGPQILIRFERELKSNTYPIATSDD